MNVVLNRTVVVDSDYNNSPIQDYVHPDDQTQPILKSLIFLIYFFMVIAISFQTNAQLPRLNSMYFLIKANVKSSLDFSSDARINYTKVAFNF